MAANVYRDLKILSVKPFKTLSVFGLLLSKQFLLELVWYFFDTKYICGSKIMNLEKISNQLQKILELLNSTEFLFLITFKIVYCIKNFSIWLLLLNFDRPSLRIYIDLFHASLSSKRENLVIIWRKVFFVCLQQRFLKFIGMEPM